MTNHFAGGANPQLCSVTFVVVFGSAAVAVIVAARIGSFLFTITMRSIVVVVANSMGPTQSIQDQTGGTNT